MEQAEAELQESVTEKQTSKSPLLGQAQQSSALDTVSLSRYCAHPLQIIFGRKIEAFFSWLTAWAAWLRRNACGFQETTLNPI
jgi:hypothetical protein